MLFNSNPHNWVGTEVSTVVILVYKMKKLRMGKMSNWPKDS